MQPQTVTPMQQFLNLNRQLLSQYEHQLTLDGGYPCKHNLHCPNWNPHKTLPVDIKDANGNPKTILRSNPCTHGGTSCHMHKRLIDGEVGGYRMSAGRSWSKR